MDEKHTFAILCKCAAGLRDEKIEELRTAFNEKEESTMNDLRHIRKESRYFGFLEEKATQGDKEAHFFVSLIPSIVSITSLYDELMRKSGYANEPAAMESLCYDDKFLTQFKKALNKDSISNARSLYHYERPKEVLIADYKEKLVGTYLGGFRLYTSEGTGKFAVFKIINEDPYADPFCADVKKMVCIKDGLSSKEEALYFMASIMTKLDPFK